MRAAAAAGMVVGQGRRPARAAARPAARHLANGAASGSTNPVADYHLVYALLLVALTATGAGDSWGLGRRWAALPIVRDHCWLRFRRCRTGTPMAAAHVVRPGVCHRAE
ncbi:hypothetical protein [Streptomyces sp. LS1784]|uniref:hypothetical protein n=1 Tax=Streptomyces sp. LS1784 TaxID=2851533 RepID=UPI0035A972B6